MTGMIHDKGQVLDRTRESEDNEFREIQKHGKLPLHKKEDL